MKLVQLNVTAHNSTSGLQFGSTESSRDFHVLRATAVNGQSSLRLQICRRPPVERSREISCEVETHMRQSLMLVFPLFLASSAFRGFSTCN